MSADKQGTERRDPPGDGTRGKKPYKKPAFQYERVFETMALACGKQNPTLSQCSVTRKVS